MKILYRPSSMIVGDDIREIKNSLDSLSLELRCVIDVIDLVVTTIQDARARGFKTNKVMFTWGSEEIRQAMYQRFFISEHNYQHLKTDKIYRACAALHDLNLIKKKEMGGVLCLVLSERLEYLVSGEHNENL